MINNKFKINLPQDVGKREREREFSKALSQTLLQSPRGSTEFWGGEWGDRTPIFRGPVFFFSLPDMEEPRYIPLGRAEGGGGAQNAPKTKTSRGRPLANQFCDPAGLLQSPKPPEPRKYEKNTKSPIPGWPPKIRKKKTGKIQKLPQNSNFCAVFVFLVCFFLVFSGANPG